MTTQAEFKALVKRMEGKGKVINKAAANVLNRAATFSKSESVKIITDEVTLEPSYVRKHIRLVARASQSKLRVKVGTNKRDTLINRFKTVKTTSGYKIAINRTGGFREIKGARIITLRSGNVGLAVNNTLFEKLTRGTGRHSYAIRAMRRKPHGMSPLHSRSVSQIFRSIIEEEGRLSVQPQVKNFLQTEFFKEFDRLNV